MAYSKSYLSTAYGICINEYISVFLLWSHDFILLSDTFLGKQIRLDGPKQFCCYNQMIVNEIKTKVMVLGNPKKSKFNPVDIEIMNGYKYLGNVVSSIRLSR